MIQANKITKRFKDRTAVDEVSLSVPEGQIFGLLGPNAAGKTTTLRMLCGIIKSDAGQIKINDANPAQAKHDFGYVAQHFGQYEELSVWENLKFYAQLYNITDEEFLTDLLNHYELTPFRKQFAGTLSGGYQRRLALACALAHDPKVLFLDEPTAGVDPVTRKMLWDEFYKLSSQGKTLFVTTHYMEEAQRCHQLAFLSSGRIVAEGTPETIKQALGEATVYVTRLAYHPELRHALLAMSGMILVNQFGNELRMVVNPQVEKQALENAITDAIGKTCSLDLSDPNLEDVFIALTQGGTPAQ